MTDSATSAVKTAIVGVEKSSFLITKDMKTSEDIVRHAKQAEVCIAAFRQMAERTLKMQEKGVRFEVKKSEQVLVFEYQQGPLPLAIKDLPPADVCAQCEQLIPVGKPAFYKMAFMAFVRNH